MQPKLSVETYVRYGGALCPTCEGNDIQVAGEMQTDNLIAWQDCLCLSCGSTWTDQYDLVGYDNLEVAV